VPEKSGGGEIDGEVKGLPEMATQSDAHVRSDDDESDEIEGDGADGVIEWLRGGMDGVEKIEDAEAGIFIEEQNHRVKDSHRQRDVAGPVVKAEIVEAVMWPGAVGAVSKGHQEAKKHVQCNGADSGEASVGREIEDGDAHGRRVGSIATETVERAPKFRGVDGKRGDEN